MSEPVPWWQRLLRAIAVFDPQPMTLLPPPPLAGLDPISRSVVLLRWHLHRSIAILSPDGSLVAVIRWCCRVGLLLAVPLVLALLLLWALCVAMGMLGGLLCSGIGIGLIFLGIVVAVIRLAR